MNSLIRLQSSLVRRSLTSPVYRLISTTPVTLRSSSEDKCKLPPPEDKNWVSYGFETKSKEDDRFSTHVVFFGGVTLCLVLGGFAFAYVPDYNLRDWATREAFIQLRKREAEGLPLIDPNFIDPSKINLPSDEELGDTEIII